MGLEWNERIAAFVRGDTDEIPPELDAAAGGRPIVSIHDDELQRAEIERLKALLRRVNKVWHRSADKELAAAIDKAIGWDCE